ncbi:MAG: helix-turn-helix domain-containing protein [Anaerolineae bacterium]|nr:helix-turn-helix domain-containing protein [Anaerolineae bacterium]NUQ05991.1 helix-turn-helix transcriptional regulator [Anaerolineae bacterium]
MGEDDIRVRFGRAVRKRRQELCLSQEELADRAGIHRTYVGDVERGERNIALQNIEKLARALGILISTLMREYGVEDSP